VNACAGVQRLLVEHRGRATKLDRLLLTHLSADTVGGLPGLIMSMADGGRASAHVVGPPGLKAHERASRPFSRRDFFAVSFDELRPLGEAGVVATAPSYADSVTITAAAVRHPAAAVTANVAAATTVAGSAGGAGADAAGGDEQAAKRPRLDGARSSALGGGQAGSGLGSGPVEVSYVFTAPPVRGRFDKAAAVALGVPPGRLFGDLHAGRPVTLPSGPDGAPGATVNARAGAIRPYSAQPAPVLHQDRFLYVISENTGPCIGSPCEPLPLAFYLAPPPPPSLAFRCGPVVDLAGVPATGGGARPPRIGRRRARLLP